jgi:hypothetical protein
MAALSKKPKRRKRRKNPSSGSRSRILKAGETYKRGRAGKGHLLGIARSEVAALREALQYLRGAIAQRPAPQVVKDLGEAYSIIETIEGQLTYGVHVNPLLAVVGNPRRRRRNPPSAVMSHDVLAIAYIHAKDGLEYVHGFGNADIKLSNGPGGEMRVRGLKRETGVKMVSQDDGSVLLTGPGSRKLWADM